MDSKTWTLLSASNTTITSATTAAQATGLVFSLNSTILRVRGHVQAFFDNTKQAGDTIDLTFGLAVLNSDAFSAGAASLPDPAGDVSFPWMWWGSMSLRGDVAASEEAWGLTAQRLEVDTKAMRRVTPADTLLMIVQSTAVAGAPATLVQFGALRVLIGT